MIYDSIYRIDQGQRPMTNTLSRTQAKKWTLGAQIASAAFVLGAVALGVVGLPEPVANSPMNTTGNPFAGMPGADFDPNAANATSNTKSTSSTQIDTLGLAQRFARLDNAPKIETNVEIDDTPIARSSDGEENTNPGDIAKRVRYIGFINDPDTRHAFIRIDGKQRVVSLGQVAKAGEDGFSDLTVERITPNHIVLTDGESRAKVKMANRTGQSITMIDGGKVDVSPAAENGSMLSAEDEARILAMPARQQPLARRRLERERRGLPPDKERRRQPQAETKPVFVGSFNKKKSSTNNE